jgi:hypothetical protein
MFADSRWPCGRIAQKCQLPKLSAPPLGTASRGGRNSNRERREVARAALSYYNRTTGARPHTHAPPPAVRLPAPYPAGGDLLVPDCSLPCARRRGSASNAGASPCSLVDRQGCPPRLEDGAVTAPCVGNACAASRVARQSSCRHPFGLVARRPTSTGPFASTPPISRRRGHRVCYAANTVDTQPLSRGVYMARHISRPCEFARLESVSYGSAAGITSRPARRQSRT